METLTLKTSLRVELTEADESCSRWSLLGRRQLPVAKLNQPVGPAAGEEDDLCSPLHCAFNKSNRFHVFLTCPEDLNICIRSMRGLLVGPLPLLFKCFFYPHLLVLFLCQQDYAKTSKPLWLWECSPGSYCQRDYAKPFHKPSIFPSTLFLWITSNKRSNCWNFTLIKNWHQRR